jgi:hypothetical protein
MQWYTWPSRLIYDFELREYTSSRRSRGLRVKCWISSPPYNTQGTRLSRRRAFVAVFPREVLVVAFSVITSITDIV